MLNICFHQDVIITPCMWIYYTIGSIVFFTILNLLQRKLSVDSKNPRAMSVIFNSYAGCIAILFFLLTQSYTRLELPKEPTAWFVVISATVLYGLFERGRFYVAKLVDASVFATIINVGLIVAFIGSIFFFSENISFLKISGAIIILIALFLVSYSKTAAPVSKKGIVLGIIISAIIGVGWLFDKKGTEYFNADTYNIFVWTIPIIFIYLPHIPYSDLKQEFKRGSWKLALLAFLNVTGYFFQLKALGMYEASRVFPLISTATIFTVLIGVFFLNEKENALRKIIAGILAVIGIYFLI